ncbi:MAG: hypothetical protein KKA73_18615, partial [Chloroflexi bacterium]|nr:hypothetical protein [Chloroflexota bacterium]
MAPALEVSKSLTIARGFVLALIVIACALTMPRPARADTIYKSGTIVSDETWTSDNVYVINGNLTVASGVTLTIHAGTVIKFEYDGSSSSKRCLTVNGILDLQGTESAPVYFTSERDDTVGGDTNGDGNTTLPA